MHNDDSHTCCKNGFFSTVLNGEVASAKRKKPDMNIVYWPPFYTNVFEILLKQHRMQAVIQSPVKKPTDIQTLSDALAFSVTSDQYKWYACKSTHVAKIVIN